MAKPLHSDDDNVPFAEAEPAGFPAGLSRSSVLSFSFTRGDSSQSILAQCVWASPTLRDFCTASVCRC